MQLLQSTGFIYDFYLFPKDPKPVSRQLQEKFLGQIISQPPRVIVLSAHTWPDDTFSYEQISNFPAFRAILARHYTLYSERPSVSKIAGYRLYILNTNPDSDLNNSAHQKVSALTSTPPPFAAHDLRAAP
jgi:hypothetical protein